MYRKLISILVIMFILQLSNVTYGSQQEGKQEKQLPVGKWTLAFNLDSLPNNEKSPVQITSSCQSVRNGVSISKITLSNISVKPITKVKILWVITESQNKNKILLYQELPFINVPSELKISSNGTLGSCITLEESFFSFSNVYNGLISDNSNVLNGDFEVSLAVSEVVFEDLSVWKRDFSPLVFPVAIGQ